MSSGVGRMYTCLCTVVDQHSFASLRQERSSKSKFIVVVVVCHNIIIIIIIIIIKTFSFNAKRFEKEIQICETILCQVIKQRSLHCKPENKILKMSDTKQQIEDLFQMGFIQVLDNNTTITNVFH
jgi:hypothetical protein